MCVQIHIALREDLLTITEPALRNKCLSRNNLLKNVYISYISSWMMLNNTHEIHTDFIDPCSTKFAERVASEGESD